jgi:hypothetical protein
MDGFEATRKAVAYYRQAQRFWPLLAVIYLLFFYGLALAVWDFAIWRTTLWGAVAGAVIALLIAFTICSHPIFTAFEDQQNSDRDLEAFVVSHPNQDVLKHGSTAILKATGLSQELQDRRHYVGLWILPAVILGCTGLLVLLARSVL